MATPNFSTKQLMHALTQTIPSDAIEAALSTTGKHERRARQLPAALVVRLIIALGLLVNMARRQVLAYLRPAGTSLPDKSSISRACARLGPRPLMALFAALARPLADPATLPGAFYHGLRLMVLDASDMDVPDTAENERIFGRHQASRGQTAYPQAKLIVLAESGTHLLVDLLVRPQRRNEQAPARQLIARSAAPGMLVLFDRGLYSYRLAADIVGRGAHFLGRVSSWPKLTPEQVLPDGSYLVRIWRDTNARRRGRAPLVVRVIEYRIGVGGETVRLVTSLLDPAAHPARELAGLYHERWEVELLLDEIKTHQQGRPNGQEVAIHAQRPAGVIQELYGLALAYNLVRTLMAASAAAQGGDPERLSFKNALVIVRRYLPQLARANQRALTPLWPVCSSRSARNACPRASIVATSAG